MWWWSWRYDAKYKAAVAARIDRNQPLSELREVEGWRRVLTDGPQTPIEAFTNALGLQIAVYCWPAATETKGIVMMAHGLDGCAEGDFAKWPGFAERKGYKGSWFEFLNLAGYTVYAADYNGMGLSESVVDGLRFMCFSWEDYVDDVVQLYALLKRRHAQLPFLLLAGSMGGCIGVLAAARLPVDAFSAACFVSPAISFERLKAKPANKVLLPIAGFLSSNMPWLPVGTKAYTEITDEQRAVGPPYFYMGPIIARAATEGMRCGELAGREAAKLHMPLMLMHAKDDAFTDYEGSLIVLRNASSTDKQMVDDFPGDEHLIPQADCSKYDRKYIAQIIAFFDARLTSGRSGAVGV